MPRLLPSLSSLTSARFTAPAIPNTSFSFFQPTLKSNWKTVWGYLLIVLCHCGVGRVSTGLDKKYPESAQSETLPKWPDSGTATLLCPHICHKHRVAQSPGLQSVDDLGWEVGVVGDGGWDAHPPVSHVLSPSSLLASSHSLQHSTRVFPIWVLK